LVPLNNDATAALLRLRRICDDNFPDTPWVFTHTKPRYFGKRINSVAKAFDAAVKRAGIAHATPHCLRHTSITESVHLLNANVVDISKVAGHKNLKTTLGYIHTADERLHQ
jgi:integrase